MDLYRLNSPTLGIQSQDGAPGPIVVPEGALLTTTASLFEPYGFVQCFWGDTTVMLMAMDLRWRAEPVQPERAAKSPAG